MAVGIDFPDKSAVDLAAAGFVFFMFEALGTFFLATVVLRTRCAAGADWHRLP